MNKAFRFIYSNLLRWDIPTEDIIEWLDVFVVTGDKTAKEVQNMLKKYRCD